MSSDRNRFPHSIAVVIHSLTGGGSEHAAAMMASYWASQGRNVTLITLDSVSNDSIPVAANVHRIGLGLLQPSRGPLAALAANYRRIRQLRKVIQEAAPDVVISLTERMNVVTILACRKTRFQVIACERTDPRHHQIGRMWERLRRWSYPKATAIVVQTDAVRKVVDPMAGQVPVRVIPNAVRFQKGDESIARIELETEKKWIIGVGRLSHEKGFDRLISAFARIASAASGWNLVLVGDGSERERLEAQAKQLDVVDRVRLVGWQESVENLVAQSAIFVLPSRYEGFPNALLEAMSCGIAPIAVDCESGPREIISDGVNGLLSGSGADEFVVTELASNIQRLIADESLRERLGHAAQEVANTYDQESHFKSWDDLFEAVISRSARVCSARVS
jgi:glycosyltransferase involved in cell wall biosynthesis